MNGWDFYKVYIPLKLHFTSNYDCLTYHGKTKTVSFENYSKRNDKIQFESWSSKFQSKEQCGQFILANFAYGNENWLYEAKSDAEERYLKWKSTRESIKKVFEHDYNVLSEAKKKVGSWGKLFTKTEKGNHPPLFQLIHADRISLECGIILDYLEHYLYHWKIEYEDDPLMSNYIFKMEKYKPFCKNLK